MNVVSEPAPSRVLGVDACKKGWVGVTSDLRAYFGESVGKLVAAAEADGALAVVGIDIPIGLPTSGSREADRLARTLVGKRWQSVFMTPIRAALEAATHAEASALSMAATGKGISQQAYRLGPKILEVDAWRWTTYRTVIEVHPEVSFATMAGHPLEHRKSTWAGVEERRALLAAVGMVLPADVGEAGTMAGVDDILDAAAVSWTATRYATGAAVSYPPTPENFGDEPTAAIWA